MGEDVFEEYEREGRTREGVEGDEEDLEEEEEEEEEDERWCRCLGFFLAMLMLFGCEDAAFEVFERVCLAIGE